MCHEKLDRQESVDSARCATARYRASRHAKHSAVRTRGATRAGKADYARGGRRGVARSALGGADSANAMGATGAVSGTRVVRSAATRVCT